MPRRATEDRNHSAHHDPAPRNTVVRSPPMLLRSSNDCRHCPLTVIFPEVDSRLPLLIRAFSELPVIRPQHLNCNTKTQAKTGRHRRTYRPESGHKGALAVRSYQARYIGEVRNRDARSPEAVPRSGSTTRRPATGRALV